MALCNALQQKHYFSSSWNESTTFFMNNFFNPGALIVKRQRTWCVYADPDCSRPSLTHCHTSNSHSTPVSTAFANCGRSRCEPAFRTDIKQTNTLLCGHFDGGKWPVAFTCKTIPWGVLPPLSGPPGACPICTTTREIESQLLWVSDVNTFNRTWRGFLGLQPPYHYFKSKLITVFSGL